MRKVQAERRDYWLQVIAQQEKSGQSVRVFCREHGVGEHSFYMWRQRLRNATPLNFALVETGPLSNPVCVELILASGDRLRIPAQADVLRTVLTVLRQPS